ncbi:MAG: GNAT family N-acetyltransferase [Elusimicrobia bacterium]|nr:GNAT family N-acetyltransferase [Elusimicrobiota bacterium]
MELQPVLEGARLRLRPLKAADFDALYAAASDPLIWEQHPDSKRHERPVFEAFFAQALKSRGSFVILDKASGEIVGTSRYYGLDLKERRVGIGFTFLTRKYWGGSCNRELKFMMLDHAFQSMRSVVFHVGENNARSRKALEKIGARPVARLDRARPDGTPDPTVVYEIKRR